MTRLSTVLTQYITTLVFAEASNADTAAKRALAEAAARAKVVERIMKLETRMD
jgi:hypothetical protein